MLYGLEYSGDAIDLEMLFVMGGVILMRFLWRVRVGTT